jgi:hypothetical protein
MGRKREGIWKRAVGWPVLFLGMLTMFACGSDNPTVSRDTLGGTAAAGAPIIGTATVKDSSNPPRTSTAPIEANGKYTIDVTGLTPPFMLRADGRVGGRDYSLFSAATAADVNGTINITPLTDLIVANIAHDVAANYYNGNNFSGMTKAALDTQAATLTATLLPVLRAVGLDNSINLLRASFNADHSGMDAVMDVLSVNVDNATKIATIVNAINNTSITQSLDNNAFSAPIDNTNLNTGTITALQQIIDNSKRVSDLFATGRPTPAQLLALGIYDNTNYLSNGRNLAEELEYACLNNPIGYSTSDITIDNVLSDNTLSVSATVYVNGIPLGRGRGFSKKNATTGKYQSIGNQRPVEFSLMSLAQYQTIPAFQGNPAQAYFTTNLMAVIRDPKLNLGANGYVVITGPGGVNEKYVNDIRYSYFVRMGTTTSTFPLTDNRVDEIPETNAEYTIRCYDNTTGTPVLSNTFTQVLLKRPYKVSDLTAASFPSISNVTPSTVSGFTSGSVSATWTLPGTLKAWQFMVLMGNAGNSHTVQSYKSQLGPSATSESVSFDASQFSNPSWSPLYANIGIWSLDSFGRYVNTFKVIY